MVRAVVPVSFHADAFVGLDHRLWPGPAPSPTFAGRIWPITAWTAPRMRSPAAATQRALGGYIATPSPPSGILVGRMNLPMRRRIALVLIGLLLVWTGVGAQSRRPTAEVAPRVDTKAPRPGGIIRLVAHVRLPEGLHVQSNKPRDPDLIPTDLSVEPPKGVSMVDIVYPKSSDLTVPGFKEPLAVYPHEFDIVVRVRLTAGVAVGALAIPATLRYQACNDSVCFPPSRATLTWTVQVAKG